MQMVAQILRQIQTGRWYPSETDLDDDNDGILDTVEGDDTVDTDTK